MKKNLLALLSVLTLSLALVSCASTPPTAIERQLFTTVTNQVTVIKEIPVPVFVTNQVVQTVTVTNALGVPTPVFYTNQTTVIAWQTNTVTATNEGYIYSISPTTKQAITAGATVIDGFAPGIGTAVGAAVLAILGGLGWLRSSKDGANKAATAAALAQEVETLRAFIQSTPNGQKYDQLLVQWLQSHQLEAGVAQEVLGLLEQKVSNPDAKVAVEAILQTYKQLTGTP